MSTSPIIESRYPHRKAGLRPSEVAILAALAVLVVVAWSHPAEVPMTTRAGLVTVAAFFALTALALGEQGRGWRYWARELLAVPVVPYLFLNLGPLIPLVNPSTHDGLLQELDRRILGPEVQAALYNLPLPWWLADVLTLAYSSMFFLPIVLAVTLAKRRDPFLPQVVTAVVLTFLVSYAGYFLLPAYGPRASVAAERYQTLPAGIVGERLRDLLDHWEKTKTDAFPSGHTMVTLAVLFCARRRLRSLYNALLPVGALLIAATVLLTYHWVGDVLAAVPLVVVSVLLASLVDGPVPLATGRSRVDQEVRAKRAA